jgi:hypothetical protein
MRTEELQGVIQALDVTLGAAPAFPEMADNYDPDVVVKKINELSGVDEDLLRDTKTIQSIREARAQMQQQQMQIQNAQVGADVGMKVAQAQSMRQGAISGRPRG